MLITFSINLVKSDFLKNKMYIYLGTDEATVKNNPFPFERCSFKKSKYLQFSIF